MHSFSRVSVLSRVLTVFAGLFLSCFPGVASGLRAETAALKTVDDFSAADHTSRGAARLLFTDEQAGGRSQATQQVADGVLKVSGEITPGRGMPGFVSVPLLLSADGAPQDVSAATGVRLKVRVIKGSLSVQEASAKIQNFDFHASAPLARSGQDFVEVRIPFAKLTRAWSEQTPLDAGTVTSVNLVSAGMAPGAFAYEVDEVGFY